MPRFSPSHHSSGTVLHIGADWTSTNRDCSMPAEMSSNSRSVSSSAWNDSSSQHRTSSASRPVSRYSDRPSSSASNVSLKDTIDVFVEDKFLKSYNLQYEPVRIRIGDDEPGAGNFYQSQPFSGHGKTTEQPGWTSGNQGSAQPQSHSNQRELSSSRASQNTGYSTKYSYRENTKTSSTTHGPPSASVISVGTPTDNYSTSRASTYHDTTSNTNKNTSTSQARQSRQGNPSNGYSVPVGAEYSVPIQRENGYNRSGNVTIPITRETGHQSNGRQTSVFSPDSGRGSAELQSISRLGGPTPLPATPIGQQATISFTPEPGHQASQGSSTSRAGSTPFPRRQKSVEFSDHPSTTPSGRPTAQADAFSQHGNGRDPVSANFSINDNGGGISVGYNNQSSPQPSYAASTSRQRSASPSDHAGVRLGSATHFSVNKSDLDRNSTPQPTPHNSASLTYAVDGGRPSSRNSESGGGGRLSWDNSPIPPAPADHMRPASRNRSLPRGDSRPSSRVGLPTYDRDYVDKSEDDFDLDDLSDEERNERLQQKKLIYPQSRNAALVAELKETTSNISAGRRSRKEQQFHDSMEKKAYSAMLDRFTAEQFIPQVPYYDEEGFPIAEYKRIFLAKQAANQARREFQNRIDAGEQVEDVAQSPEWKRLFIDSAKEEYDGSPFKPPKALPMGQKDILQINLSKSSHAGYGSKLQPWQMELKRLERFN